MEKNNVNQNVKELTDEQLKAVSGGLLNEKIQFINPVEECVGCQDCFKSHDNNVSLCSELVGMDCTRCFIPPSGGPIFF